MNIKKIFIISLVIAQTITVTAQTRIIAHRGLWMREGSAQNSITALIKSGEIGAYGSEFDVQLTKDGVIIVNHDDSINGKRIDQKMYSEIQDIRLRNGERLPTLVDYLNVGKSISHLQLILEIKPLNSDDKENECVRKTIELVHKMGMEKQVEYISFSLNVCEQLAKLTPKSMISYLKGDKSPEAIHSIGINGIDYNYKCYDNNPGWIKSAHDLGMKVNVWTVDNIVEAEKMIKMNVDYITTNIPEEINYLINK
jgi:glycerophosphoryl diester phosphodiesterase